MVIDAYDNKISIEPTLKEALDTLFKGTPSILPHVEEIPDDENPETTPAPTPYVDDIAKVTDAFNKVQEASKSNDWEAFGKAMKEMEAIINELNE